MKGQTWLVAKNTYRNKVKGAGFWAMLLSPLLIVGVIVGIWLAIGSGENESSKLAVVNNAPIVAILKNDTSIRTKISETADLDSAKKQLKDGKIDGYLSESDGKYSLVSTDQTSGKFDQATFEGVLTRAKMSQTAAQLGISATELQELMTPASLSMEIQSEKGNGSGGDRRQRANMSVSIVVSAILFFFVMLYAGMTAQEIGNEKSNRIMETLLAATSSNAQYYGKIIGIMLLALTQLVVYAAAIAAAFPFVKDMDMVKNFFTMFSSIDLTFAVFAFFMAVFGIMGYIFLAAIIASLVNEQAQVQQAVQPLTYFSMIGYFGGVVGPFLAGNIVLIALSYIPLISPTLMTSRYATQMASSTEAFIALGLQIVFTLVIAKLGERVYARNVLSYSDDKIIRQFFKNLRSAN